VTAWATRPGEERALLNPAFFSALLWHAASGYASIAEGRGLSIDLAFLVGPFVLHRDTRDALPRAVTTSLAVWLDDNPLIRIRAAGRARSLVGFTREALLFGGLHGFLTLSSGAVAAVSDRSRAMNAVLRDTSDEVRLCMKRAEFLGRWFASAGSPSTVMAVVGVRA
jgi:hypothetical protein